MSISKKIIVFLLIIISITLSIFIIILFNRIEKIETIENKFIEKNIKKFQNVIDSTSLHIKSIAFEYSLNDTIIKSVKNNNSDLITFYMDNRSDLMQNLKLSYFVLFDKNKKQIYGNSFDINSNEYLSVPEELDIFMNKNLSKYFLKTSKVFFMTLNYEKSIFVLEKLFHKKEFIGYIFIARTLDASLLDEIGELLQEYITLISVYKNKEFKNLKFFNKNIKYDISKVSKYQVFSYIKLYDELEEKDFYIRMRSNRQIFDFLINNIEVTLLIFSLILILVFLSFYLFMQKLFTNRIQYISTMVKKASKDENSCLELKINYNDEITYLSKKINEMFKNINYQQSLRLQKERDFLQSVLDSQKSIIIISDGDIIHSKNKKFDDIFSSEDMFLTNLALLDNKTSENLLNVANNHSSLEKPAKFKCAGEDNKYFTFDVKKLDIKNYLICMNDVSEFNEKISELENRASMDELTNMYNKNTITSFIKLWLEKRNFYFILFDIDFFKKVNDTYGHPAGDYVLKEMSSVVSSELAKEDIIGRFGGEEFLVLINDYTNVNIINIANRLRIKVQDNIFIFENKQIDINISLGCTFCEKGEEYKDVYKRCDKALYEAKSTGRNKVIEFKK